MYIYIYLCILPSPFHPRLFIHNLNFKVFSMNEEFKVCARLCVCVCVCLCIYIYIWREREINICLR